MVYWIERRVGSSKSFATYADRPRGDGVHGVKGTYAWEVDCPFNCLDDAKDAVRAWMKKTGMSLHKFRIVDETGYVAWSGEQESRATFALEYDIEDRKQKFKASMERDLFRDVHNPTAGGTTMGPSTGYEEKKPLHIPRTALITRLEERITEEQDKRAKAEADVAAKRQKLTDAIKAFSDDELTNLVGNSITSELKWFEEAKESGRFKSPESKPLPIESALEKQVRVLKMASDTDIEVSPHEDVYNLL